MVRYSAGLGIGATLAMAAVVAGGCSVSHRAARPTTIAELERQASAVARDGGDSSGARGGRDVAILYPAVRTGTAPAPPEIVGHDLTMRAPLADISGAGVTVTQPQGPALLALSDVRGYEVRRRGLGAVEGGLIGLLAGAAIGAVVGYSQGSDPMPPAPPCETDAPFGCPWVVSHGSSAERKAELGALVGALTGSLTGLAFGYIVGHTDRWTW